MPAEVPAAVTRVAGLSLEQLDRLGDDYAGLVAETLARTARAAVAGGEVPAVEDLARVRTAWVAWTDETLLPALGVGFEVGATTIRVALREAVGLTAAGRSYTATERDRGIDTDELTAAAWTDVPPTSDALAEHYLAQARNRLVGVGDELWSHAREELLEGLRLGEGIQELAARVRRVAPDLTEPRAEVIARSEVMGAVNAGALEQVLATGATGTKTWESGHDDRVRSEHEHADEQTVPLRDKFTVGGFPADRPHDPTLPPHLSISCRCALSFELDFDSVQGDTEPLELEPAVMEPGQALPPIMENTSGQKRDRSFLARVFGDGLAALVGWFKARTAAAMIPEREFEPEGGEMTAAATEPDGTWEGVPIIEGAWEGVLVIEGSPTGDGRQFASGALTWAELPLPLKWQEREAEGHSGAVIVGRIDSIERQGDQVIGRGVFDLDGEHGREAHRLVFGQMLRGVSIQPDDISDSDVELVFGDGQEDEGGPFARPELVIFNAGRIRSATLCAEAAFVEAEVRLTSGPAVVAAVVPSIDAYRPRREFFTRCTDPIPTLATPDGRVFQPLLTVSDEGRVWGYAAQWGECHIGFAGACTSPPEGDDYAHYLLGEVLCADGSRVPVGQITLGTGHADITWGARAAAEHYDNTGAVVADVVVGTDDYGIWLSGAVRPGSQERVDALRAAGAVSGDWRRIGGSLRLVALLAVNGPGFQQTRARVASGVQQALVAAGSTVREVTEPDLSRVKERIAASIKRDRPSRRQELAERVKAGRK